ncbi:MAG: UDP-N-acetylmuramoyl-L-alanine--D-glutamate ligase [Acidobacteria bacterium]|nr:MAG: UDP-N-acetylmuramoyl-L-alanine--D-glutamate ligase [Acidobacteriota bacterium]
MSVAVRVRESAIDRSRRRWSGRSVLVVGLGRSGCAAARHLLAAGARVTAVDLRPLEELGPEPAALRAAGVAVRCGPHDVSDFLAAEAIVLSPGVPADRPEVRLARERGAPVLTEIDLVAPAVSSRTVAITGSNGKSTVTALVAAMLGEAGYDAVPCGNFGLPLADAVQGDHPGRRYSLELSSFQLETTSELRAAAAVLLNVQPDHIDRHGTFEAYLAAKARIAKLRSPGAPLIVVRDDPGAAAVASNAEEPVLEVSAGGPVGRGGGVEGGRLVLRLGAAPVPVARADALPLPGRHNLANALAAACAAATLGAPPEAIRRALETAAPLPHRLEPCGTVDGVRYVDDSKATNVAAAVAAVDALAGEAGTLFVLLGGRDKEGDFSPLAERLAACRAVPIVFGEAGEKIAAVLEARGLAPRRARTLEEAARAARAEARAGDVVLLAPACASFDAFPGFAARGDAFAKLVRRFAGEEP